MSERGEIGDVDKVVEKVYHTKQLQTILDDIIKDFIEQVVLMDDEELNEDRSEWIKKFSNYNKDKRYLYITSIHTLAIEIEQLRRLGKIIYDIPKKDVRLV